MSILKQICYVSSSYDGFHAIVWSLGSGWIICIWRCIHGICYKWFGHNYNHLSFKTDEILQVSLLPANFAFMRHVNVVAGLFLFRNGNAMFGLGMEANEK